MYRCILVPLDGTPFGEGALPHAALFAQRARAVLHLAHVHLPPIIPSGAETAALPPVWIEMSWDEKKRYLDGLAERIASTYDIRVETRVMEGGVAAALERHAVRCAAGLIVMSTHGHVGLSRLWHHGVADQLARDLPLPILLVRPANGDSTAGGSQRTGFSNILIALDGSADSERIIEHAVTLGRVLGARFTMVRVVPPATGGTGSGLPVDPGHGRTSTQIVQTSARQYLNALAERLRSRGLEVATEVLVHSDPGAGILQFVRGVDRDPQRRFDLVAVESPERGAVTRLFFRGTADELIREVTVPLLLFQAPRTTAGAGGVIVEPGLVGSG